MITNEQMTPHRYGDMYLARNIYRQIMDTFKAGGCVVTATMTQARQYDARHVEYFRLTDGHRISVRQGKHWYPIVQRGMVLVGIRFGRPAH